jgi:hypothetical protein
VLQIAVHAENIPADFPVRSASDVLDYGDQEISGHHFLLPTKAEMIMSRDGYLSKNSKEFRMYQKYSADASIKYDEDTTPPAGKKK